jgi:vancomycin resistance protein YoaR
LELLGTGYSNFSGSPNNRRHNIATGSAALHGLVIPPDKEFSLGEALGPIEKETGYLPELVIKGDKTVPEYGGGLCQVGTTTFRAAMASGLPITERRNHSYSVSYYLENGLPGTDATIYPPHPDLRFLNDTGQYILIQVRSAGNDLYYDLWGKPDGRIAERTTPRIWDRVSPPPTKEVETTDLAPGVRKCTERAHTGLKAEFTYTVKYANGEIKEQVFRSTYKPWQEVCLVGKAA